LVSANAGLREVAPGSGGRGDGCTAGDPDGSGPDNIHEPPTYASSGVQLKFTLGGTFQNFNPAFAGAFARSWLMVAI
jgi:hypothetical protein